MPVALTGATGFIGCTVARLLAQSGFSVRALIRPASNARRFDLPGLEWVEGDLDNPASLDRLVAGAGTVVHCAGVVRGVSAADFNPINIGGVERLVKAAQKLPILPNFLLFSSLAAREPDLSPYAASKRGGETLLASMAGEMRWLALRPPAVYGPGDRELLPLFKWMRKGVLPIPGDPEGRFSLIFVDDLARAVIACLLVDRVWPGECFELHDGMEGGYGWDDVSRIMSQIYQRRIRRLVISEKLLLWIGEMNSLMGRVFRYRPMLTPGKVRELNHHDWVCANRKLQRFCGWEPTVSFVDGVKRTLEG